MANTVKNLLKATGDFSLILDAAVAPTLQSEYDAATADFGQIKSLSIINSAERKEHFGNANGVLVRDAIHFTKHILGYKLTCEEFDPSVIRALFFAGAPGADATIDTQAYQPFTPLSAPQMLKGFARLRLWDHQSTTKPRLIHTDFSCQVVLASQPDFGEDWASVDLEVLITSTLGIVNLRKDA